MNKYPTYERLETSVSNQQGSDMFLLLNQPKSGQANEDMGTPATRSAIPER